jgi:phospholipase C
LRPFARVAVSVLIVLTLWVAAYPYVEAELTPPARSTLTPLQQGFMDHIQHIVFLVLENHAYDSMYGTYCLVKSKLCPHTGNGVAQGYCIPLNPGDPSAGCKKPYNFTAQQEKLNDIGHMEENGLADFNGGSLNFYLGEGHSGEPFGHYNGSTSPTFWDIAEEFSLEDNFFSSLLDYSLPNHWHIIAGQAPAISLTNTTEAPEPGQGVIPFINTDHEYLNESNDTRSIEDLLINSTVSWSYYDDTLSTYAKAIQIQTNANKTKVISTGSAYQYWNPQAAKAESYSQAFVTHYVPNTEFYADAKAGNLPSLSWVIPAGQDSDHPGDNNTVAQEYVASIVDAVETSPDWNSTALYITWDDWGGFYDHVLPPLADGQQLGFRVPLLIVSPYSVKGAIPDQEGYFESVLHTMEWRFHLGCVAQLDCNAPLALYGFDFSGSPRAPVLFPTNSNESVYPFNSNWNTTEEQAMLADYAPPNEFVSFPNGEAPDVD